MRRAVIWDIGGTIVGRTMTRSEILRRAFAVAGLGPARLAPEELASIGVRAREGEKSWRTPAEEEAGFLSLASHLLGDDAPGSDVRSLGLRLADYFDAYELVPGMRDILESLSARGVAQAAVSEWPPSLRRFLDHHDLARYFAAVVVTAEEGVLKPAPALIETALKRIGREPEDSIYVGDHPVKDIEPARQLGLTALHFDPLRTWDSADVREASELGTMLDSLLGDE